VSYESIMRELQEGKYRPVYYLHGEESYYIDKISDYIAEHALAPEERDFNQTVFFGSDVNASQVADAARRYPMMAERQVVIVKEAQNIKQTDALEKYMKQPLASTVLVMCHKNGKIDGRKREYVKVIQQAASPMSLCMATQQASMIIGPRYLLPRKVCSPLDLCGPLS